MTPSYGAVHGHCRELVALRRDFEALERRYMEDLARLQEQLDAERAARKALTARFDWAEYTSAA